MIERVEGLLGQYPRGLYAGTFHSVANKLLRKYATRIGYEPNFSILSDEDSRDLISLCVKDLKIDTKNGVSQVRKFYKGIYPIREIDKMILSGL